VEMLLEGRLEGGGKQKQKNFFIFGSWNDLCDYVKFCVFPGSQNLTSYRFSPPSTPTRLDAMEIVINLPELRLTFFPACDWNANASLHMNLTATRAALAKQSESFSLALSMALGFGNQNPNAITFRWSSLTLHSFSWGALKNYCIGRAGRTDGCGSEEEVSEKCFGTSFARLVRSMHHANFNQLNEWNVFPFNLTELFTRKAKSDELRRKEPAEGWRKIEKVGKMLPRELCMRFASKGDRNQAVEWIFFLLPSLFMLRYPWRRNPHPSGKDSSINSV
jgi:hypothetical protein